MPPEWICEIECADVTVLSDPALFSLWLARMPERRREKIAAFRHAESQRLSLGVGILLYRAMKRKSLDPESAQVSEGPHGKPFLAGHPETQFSLSHAGSWAMCAVCGRPVGCDAETVGRGSAKLARRFFHPEEQKALAEIPDTETWQREFTRIWTRKESLLKATGEGLSRPLNSFSVLSPEDGVRYDERETAEGMRFACCVLGGGEGCFNWRTAGLAP